MHLIREDLAIALRWTPYESKAVAQRALKGTKGLLIAGKQNRNTFIQGVVDGSLPLFGKPVYSAALAFAEVCPTFVVHQLLAEDMVWFCAVSNGEPLTDLDVICTAREANLHLADMRASLNELVMIGNHPLAEMSLDAAMEKVIKPVKSARLASPDNSKKVTLVALVAIILLLASGLGYVFFGGQDEEDPAAIAAMQAMILQQQQAAAEVERLQKIADLASAARETALDAPSVLEQYRAWHNLLRQVPASVAGWRSNEVACAPDQCSVIWSRGEGVLPSSASLLPGMLIQGDFTQSATTTFMLDPLPVYSHKDASLAMSSYVADLAARKSLVTWVFAPLSNEIKVVLPPELVREGEVPPSIAKEGTFDLTGQNLFAIDSALRDMALPGVKLMSLKIAGFNGGISSITANLQGSYRERL